MYFMMLSESRGEGRSRRKDISTTCSGTSDTKRVSFMQQRSHSCGDISPTETEVGWIDEDDDIGGGTNHLAYDDDDMLNDVRQRSRQLRPEATKSRNTTEVPNIEQRRQNWLKQKQRSKSSDFSWRSGMWSPVEDSSRVLIIVPSPKRFKPPFAEPKHKNKFKLPALFQMDSGSSYESNEMNEVITSGQSIPLDGGMQKQQQQKMYPAEGRTIHSRSKHPSTPPNQCDPSNNLLNVSKPTIAHLSPTQSSRNRLWSQNQPKSHSLDSSFDDSKDMIHSTSSWRFNKNANGYKSNIDNSYVDRQKPTKQDGEIIGTSPNHLFYTYNQSSRTMERKSFKGSEFLSKQTSERIRAGSEEIKHLRMKNKSPEIRRAEMLDPKSAKHLSPHQYVSKPTGVEKRTTFSQQKSFSYDIPSPHPKHSIEYRKKSEPIVSSTYRTHASRGKLILNSQMFSLDRGGPGKRIDIQNLKSFSKILQVPSRPHDSSVEIFITPIGDKSSPDVGMNAKRNRYCSQRSQSCETDNRNILPLKRPSVSDQFLTTSPGGSRRDYLTKHELRQFEIEIPASPYSTAVQKSPSNYQASTSSRRSQFLNQKSQSCEIAYPTSKQILQGKELRTLMGYPRLFRQLAKSDIGVEPIMEKDSSGSSKDAPEPPVPPKSEPSTDVKTHSPKVLYSKKFSCDVELQDSKPLGKHRDLSSPRIETSGENKFQTLAQKTKTPETDIYFTKSPRSVTRAKTQEGRLVSDGIVTWRRKLPEVDAATAYEKFEKLVEMNRCWVEEKKLKFVQHPHFKEDSRTGIDSKRTFYAQQKSFSYESEQHHHHHHHHAQNMRGESHAMPPDAPRHVIGRRHQLVDFKRKSYSLDDKVPCQRDVLTPFKDDDEGEMFVDPIHVKMAPRGRSEQPQIEIHQEVKEAKQKQQKKLAMLHVMEALNDNDDINHHQPPPSDLDRGGRLCKKRMSCRLSLGKLFSKLKPEKLKK